ncbi:GNAT family N-acetyltransferase [Microbispora sp. RL4-1S]|uniref:GNAT family N-acetyltransferase n=1 Tax=Microbispora oryzae TaxID=2806554 RepID=A0A941AHI9_9ACTN|nr:GNAT family N-acetyltransferase [Microbispora oryzae]MBP2702762.1 GNAT family N-acetyltransferase [Microbispora oryzae]
MSPFITPSSPSGSPYTLALAQDSADVWDALRLRHQVLPAELGTGRVSPVPGIDIEEIDLSCDHVLVRERATGLVAGTCRLLPPARARILHADGRFDLGRLAGIRRHLVEVGRVCLHPAHRDGAVMRLLWSGMGAYARERGHTWLAGSYPVPLHDGGVLAAGVWDRVSRGHLAPPHLRVSPLGPWPSPWPSPWPPSESPPGPPPQSPESPPGSPPASSAGERFRVPPLLQGHLRLGARVCGPPAHDPVYCTAEFFLLLSLNDTDNRYARHVFGVAA